MEKLQSIPDLTFHTFAGLVSDMSHAGLIIMVVRPEGFALPETKTDEVTESVSFGGCFACLANAIAQKMIDDPNFCTLITTAAELYTNNLYGSGDRAKCSDNG